MPSHRRHASACMALLGVVLLFVMPCTTRAVVVAAEDTAMKRYVDYFLGDLFENPSSMNRNKQTPLGWAGTKSAAAIPAVAIHRCPHDGVLAFDCAGDVPTLHVVPRSDAHAIVNNDGRLPPMDNTCGGGALAGMTPTQYKFTRPGGGNDTTGWYSALFWGRPSAGEEERAPPPLMPLPKFQLKAILKVVAALMESSWRNERGEEAMPESVAFSGDMVVFYFDIDHRWLVAMGREDVEFRQPWEKLHGEIKPLNLGTVV